MTAKNRVASYFDGVASNYQKSSDGVIWGLVRRREAASVIAKLGNITGRQILELGSGAGYYTRLMLREGASHVYAVDLSTRMLNELPADNVTPIAADATSVNPGRTFDLILSAGMLEFVPHPERVLTNAARFANPDARFVILFPKLSSLGRIYQRFHAHNGMAIELFDQTAVEALVCNSGWRLAGVSTAGPYSSIAVLTRD